MFERPAGESEGGVPFSWSDRSNAEGRGGSVAARGCTKGIFPLRGVTGPVLWAVLGAEPLAPCCPTDLLEGGGQAHPSLRRAIVI